MPLGKELSCAGKAILKAKDLNEKKRHKDDCTLMEKVDVTLLKRRQFVKPMYILLHLTFYDWYWTSFLTTINKLNLKVNCHLRRTAMFGIRSEIYGPRIEFNQQWYFLNDSIMQLAKILKWSMKTELCYWLR